MPGLQAKLFQQNMRHMQKGEALTLHCARSCAVLFRSSQLIPQPGLQRKHRRVRSTLR
jgi:hypothetical protein